MAQSAIFFDDLEIEPEDLVAALEFIKEVRRLEPDCLLKLNWQTSGSDILVTPYEDHYVKGDKEVFVNVLPRSGDRI